MPPSPSVTARQLQAHAGDAARLLKVLANEHRLAVLCTLMSGELSVSSLNARIELSQSALSQHLAVLRNEQLVTTRREAQEVIYSLAEGPVRAIIATLHGIYCAPKARRRT